MKLKRSILAGAVVLGLAGCAVAYAQGVMQYLNGSGQPQAVTTTYGQGMPIQGSITASIPGTVNVALSGNGPGSGVTPVSVTTSGYVVPGAANSFFMTQGTTAGYLALIAAGAIPSSGASISPIACVAVPVNTTFHVSQPAGYQYYNPSGITMLDTTSCSTYTPTTPLSMGTGL